jgi:hypothetical protein
MEDFGQPNGSGYRLLVGRIDPAPQRARALYGTIEVAKEFQLFGVGRNAIGDHLRTNCTRDGKTESAHREIVGEYG